MNNHITLENTLFTSSQIALRDQWKQLEVLLNQRYPLACVVLKVPPRAGYRYSAAELRFGPVSNSKNHALTITYYNDTQQTSVDSFLHVSEGHVPEDRAMDLIEACKKSHQKALAEVETERLHIEQNRLPALDKAINALSTSEYWCEADEDDVKLRTYMIVFSPKTGEEP